MPQEHPHLPVRPSWICARCTLDWPCPSARRQLVAEHDPVALGTYAAQRMAQAAHDLPGISPADLFDRFLSWTRGE
ncbi:flavin reductase [Solwaraspora sp. WMMD406]|uniref:flavin reductase n=1 Tax=Solwaraspora sp. WMMD406 TaxID=3016095 RepID=UPI002417C6BA|nr:flavin reductase [Solwaraspora sp. WMMD406]MDG4765539.1 flavin reductase [Solwaraspora sp. WMMD406]